jgi:outer membrane assembly lipoprotein YfiO
LRAIKCNAAGTEGVFGYFSIMNLLRLIAAIFASLVVYNAAILRLNNYIKLYPEHFSTPYAYYLRGVISEDKSRSILDNYLTDNAQRDVKSVRNAFNYYMALIDKFPNTEYTEEAKTRLIILRNILARHELFVAVYYTTREANIAAINRTKFIIEKYRKETKTVQASSKFQNVEKKMYLRIIPCFHFCRQCCLTFPGFSWLILTKSL